MDQGIFASSIQLAAAGRNTSPLSQIAGIQALWDVDATLAASYSGSGQTWSNLIASPDDGAAQTAYDFYRGASSSSSTDDPAFNGTANDPAAYWSFDGGDYLTLAGGNTAFLKNLHKTTGGSNATIILAMKSASSLSSFAGWGTRQTSGGHGIRLVLSAAAQFLLSQSSTSGSSNNTLAGVTYTANADFIIAHSFTCTPTVVMKGACNSRTFGASGSSTNASTTDPASTFQIFASGSSGSAIPAPSGARLYGCYGFNKILSDSELSSVIDVLNSRHNRTYA